MNKYCLILGSSSEIGIALAYQFAARGYHIILASRNIDDNQLKLQNDIAIRNNVTVQTVKFNGTAYAQHPLFWESLTQIPDIVIAVFGYLGNQTVAMQNFDEAYTIMSSNYIGQVSLINSFLPYVRGKKEACIIGISSVAGDRGRKSNFMYGSSKAAFTAYLSGLRNDLYNDNIHVITILPGFVKTKMLGGLSTPKFLTASPTHVALKVFKAYKKKKNIVYIYSIWRLIMLIIKNIPEVIFKKMNL